MAPPPSNAPEAFASTPQAPSPFAGTPKAPALPALPALPAIPSPGTKPVDSTDVATAAATFGAVPAAIPQSTADAITAPAKLPFAPLPAPAVPSTPAPAPPESAAQAAAEPARAKPVTNAPPMEEIDDAWDLGDDDPTATTDAAQASATADEHMARPEQDAPSSSEMAGDSATGGDGIDEPGWD